jgi:uncharacterized membrane protein
MALTICNGFSTGFSIAIGWPSSNQCAQGGKWMKKGWWTLAPGRCARVYGGSLRNFSRMAYYARTRDRTLEWRGRLCTLVTDGVFEHCWNHATRDGRNYQVCFRLLDINHRENYTLHLSR